MKNMLRSILAVISAPLVYGLICVPTVSVLVGRYPEKLNDGGGTFDVALTLQVELVQLLALLLIGAIVAALSPSRRMLHVAIAVVPMLAIAVLVQVSAWDVMLTWHHFVFFFLIVAGMPAGGLAWGRLRPERTLD